jgi:MFS family permease
MSHAPRPRTARASWVIWGVAVAAYVVAVLHRTAFGVASAEAVNRFGIGATALSLLAVVQIAVYAAMQVPGGTLLDRWGPARVIVAGSLVMATGQALMAFAPGFGWALAARALVGAGDAPIFIAVTRLVAIHFPSRRVPVMVQITGLIGQTGQLASAIPLAYLLHRSGWSVAFAALAGLGVVAAGAVWRVLVRPARRAEVQARADAGPQSDTRPPSAERPRSASVADALTTHWRTPGVRLGFWSHFLGPFSANTIALVWGVPYFTTAQGRSPADASLLLTCMVLANIAVAPFIGMATATIPTHRSWLVLGGAAVTALTWTALLLPTTPRPLWQLVGFVLVIGAGGPMSLVGMDFARSFAAEHRAGSAAGFVNMGGFIATIIGVLLVGVVLEVTSPRGASTYTVGEYRLAFAALAVPWTIGVVGVYLSRRDTRAGLAEDGILIPTLREAWRRRAGR